MLNHPFHRLFAHDLPDESVDLLFTFLTQLTDLCFEAYQEQIVRMAQDSPTRITDPHELLDLDELDEVDDEIPF